MRNTNVKKLTVCSVMIALAAVLSLIKVVRMPLGGSVTLLSMLPIALISVMYGLRWGMLSSLVYSVIQLIFGITIDGLLGWGLNAEMLIGCIAFDYIVAYSVIGLAGIVRDKGTVGAAVGTAIALALRFFSHLMSGVIIFANFEEFVVFGKSWVGRPWLYSICYNGLYMLPELIVTAVAIAFVVRVPVIKRIVREKE